MRNKLLKFTDFKGGISSQDPKKQMDSAGGSPKKEKPKSFDQVKRAKLAQLNKTEPDYSKTKKMNEDSAADISAINAAAAEIQDLELRLATAKNKLLVAQTKAATNQQKEVAAAGNQQNQAEAQGPQKTA